MTHLKTLVNKIFSCISQNKFVLSLAIYSSVLEINMYIGILVKKKHTTILYPTHFWDKSVTQHLLMESANK